jgi:hypothetical protein
MYIKYDVFTHLTPDKGTELYVPYKYNVFTSMAKLQINSSAVCTIQI